MTLTRTCSRAHRGDPSKDIARGLFWRLGKWSAVRRWYVVAAWALILAGVTFGSSLLNGSFNQEFALPNTSAQVGWDLLEAHTKQGPTPAVAGRTVFNALSGDLHPSEAMIESSAAEVGGLSRSEKESDYRLHRSGYDG